MTKEVKTVDFEPGGSAAATLVFAALACHAAATRLRRI